MAKSNRVGIVGDTHVPYMVDGYPEWCAEVFDQWGVNRIVHIGDVADLGTHGFHQAEIGYRDPEHELTQAREDIANMVKVFGKKVEVTRGNHCSNIERKAAANDIDPRCLKPLSEILECPWHFYPRFYKLEIDDYIIFHGDQGRGGATPQLAKAKAEWRNVCVGHHHSAAGVIYGCNDASRFWGLSVGCGVNGKHPAMAYGRGFAAKGMLGCGVVIDGIPYFEPMPKVNKFGRVIR